MTNSIAMEMLTGSVETFAEAQPRTEAELREAIEDRRKELPGVMTDEEAEALFDRMRREHDVAVDLGAALVEPGFGKWLDETRRNDTEWFYWSRYKRYLAKSGLPATVIRTMHDKTDLIIGLCGDPLKEGAFDRRGMVMGDVQAGKTGNYTALISKAADAGYRVIIVIAGIHENLRSQTQKRIDEGLIGRNSDLSLMETAPGGGRVGVGKMNSSRTPTSFTTRKADFKKGQAAQLIRLDNIGREPVVFVIKKNASVLKHLIAWLRGINASRTGTIGQSLILIDDEADNASINVAKGADAVSRINGQIRELLNLFDKSSYVAFTATPFANIFIDPDVDHKDAGRDLFPENFLITLDRPETYYGAEKVFLGSGEKPEDTPTRDIGDNDPHLPLKMPKGSVVTALPASLLRATRSFIVSGAIRRLRGQSDKHHSMLVNVSHLTSVQKDVASLLRQFLEDTICPVLNVHGNSPAVTASRTPEIAALREVFDSEFAGSGENWTEVLPELNEVAKRTKVHEVNSRSADRLDYSDVEDAENDQVTAIAVGGYSLSRGLTLEGLTISYFLRNSKAYDTLLQMARWFGYRLDYEDLCRVWIKDEARDWYAHIAEASEELRQDLSYMAASNDSPRKFGLRVQTHPSALEVTARNKAGEGREVTVKVALGLTRIETAVIYDNRPGDEAEANRQAVVDFHRTLDGFVHEDVGATRLYRDVPASSVKDYLWSFRNHNTRAVQTQVAPVVRYIEEREDERLGSWDIAFVGSNNPVDPSVDPWTALGFPLSLQQRTPGSRKNGAIAATSYRFSSRGVAAIGMSEEAIVRARESTAKKNIPDINYLRERERPLLAVHVLHLLDSDQKVIGEPPVTAWTICFPETGKPTKAVSYKVNTVWWRNNREEMDEEVGEALDREES